MHEACVSWVGRRGHGYESTAFGSPPLPLSTLNHPINVIKHAGMQICPHEPYLDGDGRGAGVRQQGSDYSSTSGHHGGGGRCRRGIESSRRRGCGRRRRLRRRRRAQYHLLLLRIQHD